MKRKVLNVAFIAVAAVILCSSLGNKTFMTAEEYLGIELDASQTRSYLEGRSYNTCPKPTINSIASGTFQDQAESFVADLFPQRDAALMVNAAAQRAGVQLAASLCGYSVFPTFYGSDIVYDAEHDLLAETSQSSSKSQDDQWEKALSAFNAHMTKHPDCSYVFYEFDRISSSSNNPTRELVSNPIDTTYLEEHFYSQLDNDAYVINGTYSSLAELSKTYFRTDHHWTAQQAYKAYCDIAQSFNAKPIPKSSLKCYSWQDVDFWGSVARTGLCKTNAADIIEDYWIDIPNLKVTLDGKSANLDSLDHRMLYESGQQSEALWINRYAEYYHTDYGIIELENPDAISDEILVVAGDSFTNNMERFLSYNFRRVVCIDPRHTDITLDEVIEQEQARNVLIMLGSTNLNTDATLACLG